MADDVAPEQAAEPEARPIKVAGVVDQYRVVLNVGSRDGIRPHNRFLVYAVGADIMDPDTGENLGPLEIVRGRGKVEHLQEKLCTIISTDSERAPGSKKIIRHRQGNVLSGLLGAYNRAPFEEIEEDLGPVLLPFENAVVGDFARLL